MKKLEYAEVIAFIRQSEFATEPFELYVADDQVGLARGAIRDDWPLHAGNDGLYVGLIQAKNRGTIKRNAIDELHECILNIFQRGILIQMLAVDRGHNRHHWSQQQEAAVTFVRLNHEEFALAEPRRGAGLIHAPADHKRRIQMRRGKHGRNDRSRGRLSVRSSHRNAVLQAHQLSQHLRTRDNRNLFLMRFDHLWIFYFDGG